MHLAHDADEYGDKGAVKAAAIIGGRTLRVRPPDGLDWCDWAGNRQRSSRSWPQLAQARPLPARHRSSRHRADAVDRVARQAAPPGLRVPPSPQARRASAKAPGSHGQIADHDQGRLGPKRNVLIVSSEDSAEIDLEAAARRGRRRPHPLAPHRRGARAPARPRTGSRTSRTTIGDVGLIVLDPVGNHLGGVDTDKEGLVRSAIGGLNQLADDLACMIFGVRHLAQDARTRRARGRPRIDGLGRRAPRRARVRPRRRRRDDLPRPGRRRQPQRPHRRRTATGSSSATSTDSKNRSPAPSDSASPRKNVDDLLASRPRRASRSAVARELILDILEEDDGAQESDALDARVARGDRARGQDRQERTHETEGRRPHQRCSPTRTRSARSCAGRCPEPRRPEDEVGNWEIRLRSCANKDGNWTIHPIHTRELDRLGNWPTSRLSAHGNWTPNRDPSTPHPRHPLQAERPLRAPRDRR